MSSSTGSTPSSAPTPAPRSRGELDFPELYLILATLARSDHRILGFDLVEVVPDPSSKSEWDASVGMRLPI